MKRIAALVILLTSVATPAHALVALSPEQATAGQTIDLQLAVTSDVDDQPTSRVEVTFAEDSAVHQVDAAFMEGWSSTVDRGPADAVTSITWEQGSIPPGATEVFTVTVTVPTTAEELSLSAIQAYADGTVKRYGVEGTSDLRVAVTGAVATSTTSTAAPLAADANTAEEQAPKRSSVGFYFILFGISVVMLLYFRSKKLARDAK